MAVDLTFTVVNDGGEEVFATTLHYLQTVALTSVEEDATGVRVTLTLDDDEATRGREARQALA